MITIKAITLRKNGREILKNFSLNVSPAQILVITGPNGCGKSTLLSAIAGDISPDSGEIKIDNIPTSAYSAKALSKKRAMVIQTPSYNLGFTVRQIISMAGVADKVLKELAITGIANRLVTTLSGGEIQKVAIAQSLAQQTPLLILDEPLSAQDLKGRKRLIKLLQDRAKAGCTVIIVAHSDEKELSWADKVIKFPAIT